MRLQIAQAVVGSPEVGDELRVSFEGDDSPLVFEYVPHGSFDRFVWMTRDQTSQILEAFNSLEERGIESEWAKCYADDDWEIVVGQKLHLVLVPRGNMHDWPRFTSPTKISHIEIV